MLRTAWDTLCALSREEARAELDIESRTIRFKGACLLCNGEPPEEVRFIELPLAAKEREMGSVKKWTGKCDCCGETKTVRSSGGKNVCAMCDNLRINIRLRPQVAMDAIRELAPDLLGEVGSGDGFARLQKYSNKVVAERDDLVVRLGCIREAIKAEADEDLVDVAKRRMDTMARLEESYLQESKALSSAETERDDLKRQLEQAGSTPPLCVSASCRQAMQDLALRLAIGVMKGEIEGIGAADVELLRSC